MTVEYIMFVLTIAITTGMIVWSWVMASFMDKTSKTLKDIQDNQFDTEQVMNLYQQKYNRPIIMKERADIVELKANYSLPYEYRNEITEAEIHLQLVKELTEHLGKYVDVIANNDIVNMTTEYKARLRVIDSLKTD